ncbi:helix-turn-helix domain-containing protein [Salipiger sp. 1_MG-2023]|uniref:MarR family transcriptional regulator n=1 Tax=Salipiger sp. 1_MG-2023 TaxID=3062665 RepID=UPI0026E3FDA6|nr:helix-turn-helix domain-containing protein [Salipiger sp. 1_MG-2023]MDO6587354.1 helix-turn-helix domain-containing protein [Salipiger sp. 1_MG-2023]
MTKLGPKREALAYRIWTMAQRRGWENITQQDIADELRISAGSVSQILIAKGWGGRTAGTTDERREHTSQLAAKGRGARFDTNILDVVEMMR